MNREEKEAMFLSFYDEVEKIALSIQRVHVPGMLAQGVAGKHVKRETLMAENPALAKQFGVKTGKDILFIAPESDYTKAFGARGKAGYKAITQHELTHYLRGKRGKMKRFGTQGLRGLGATAREELIAHLAPVVRARDPGVQKALSAGVLPGVVASVRHAYKGQPLRQVALGGTLGRVGKALKLIK